MKGRAPQTGYSRERFGQTWYDDNRNGCDTRNDILRRDITSAILKPDSNGCVVLAGALRDPYSGQIIHFQRSASTASSVQIDHVVALSDAWQTGAQTLSPEQRRSLANDPGNLLAVSGRLNEQKSDSDAASWLPPNTAYRCAYVSRQVAVKLAYRLWVTAAEKSAIVAVLSRCAGQPLPPVGARPDVTFPAERTTIPTAEPTTLTTAEPTTASPRARSPSRVFYANCTAVRAAGAAPLHAGDPVFRAELDRDGNGAACQ